ncbi:LysR family transcriptional regulator [Microvirga alba]|uniref:LysR family transcriptional regulator n=1 Tax=Microvirga alba TaxID=2791025 RepID=A0A931BSN8_9HYPH|nr:LysR family transcriptional regulator [Microvirga alba]MBF9233080.1 LysR family transcriptional regulator [Microvirga alba]
MQNLDPASLHAFVLIADLKNFTRAAEVLNTTQAAVSLKLKRLEARLGRVLVERTPRSVRLTSDGVAFLEPAREVVAAHRRAAEAFTTVQSRLVVGVTHHIVGADLPMMLKRLNEADRATVLELRIGTTRAILESYDAGALDAAIVVRYDESRRDGEKLVAESFGWFSSPSFAHFAGEPIPLAMQADPCRLRKMAVDCLDRAGLPWREAFIGGGVATIGSAAAAGIAVAALARRVAPGGTIDVGDRLGLPPLPARDVMLHSKVSTPQGRAALRSLAAAFKATASA